MDLIRLIGEGRYYELWLMISHFFANHFFIRLTASVFLGLGFFFMFRRRRIFLGFSFLLISLIIAIFSVFSGISTQGSM